MGKGYWILVWDDWSAGLTMVNARLHSEGLDMNNNPKNWFTYNDEISDKEIIEKHKLNEQYKHFRILR